MSRILVVEDESAIAELISINLRHAGYEVTLAGNAEQAQLEVDRVLPDLVVLDWMLPGQTGLALARQWRGAARTRELPIILLTARAEEVDKVSGLDAGAQHQHQDARQHPCHGCVLRPTGRCSAGSAGSRRHGPFRSCGRS